MPWCPKCRTEYREGFSKCTECDEWLVDKLEPVQDDAEEELEEDREFYEAFLLNVADEIEANLIECLLNSYGIPVIRRQREPGDCMNIYMGKSITGIDLFVPPQRLLEAMDIINKQQSKPKLKIKGPKRISSSYGDNLLQSKCSTDNVGDDQTDRENLNRFVKWVFGALIVGFILLFVLYNIAEHVSNFR